MSSGTRGKLVPRVLPILALLGAGIAPAAAEDPLTLERAIPLPGVEGRIDHMAIDTAGGRLFVAALGNNSLAVVDLSTSVVHGIHGLAEPQGVAFLPETGRIYVANGGSGECDVFDGSSLAVVKRIDLGGDADNMHADTVSRRLLVSAGNGLSIIDTVSDIVIGRVELSGHPEGFALEQGGTRVFANVPLARGRVFVVDRDRGASIGQWPVGGLFANLFSNFPLSLDEKNRRVFVGTRVPARLKVLDSDTGRVVADVAIDGDPDDIFLDGKRHLVYLSCGAGYLDVVAQLTPDGYAPPVRIPTAPGARTSLWVPEMDRLFLAVPHRGNQRAEIRVYKPELP